MIDTYTVILIALSAAFLAVLIAIVVFMGYLRKILSIASFMSPNATVFAIGAKYTEKENILKILEMTSVTEIINDAKKEGYNIEDTGKADVHIEKDMLRMMNEVIGMMPEGVRQFSEAYMLKYDANIVKRILRAKYMKVPKHIIYTLVYEGRTITKLIMNHMIEASSVEDSISALDATPFKSAIKVWGETNDLYEVEMEIDKTVIERLKDAKMNLDEDSREVVEKFLSILIDIQNIKNVIRAKNAEIKNIDKFLIEGGYEISEWKLKSMAEARNIEEVLGQLEGTSYSFLRDMKEVFEIEIALDRYMLRVVNDIGLTYSVSAGPIVMFLVAKEYEARNLKAIVKGFVENIPKERIKSLLVGDLS